MDVTELKQELCNSFIINKTEDDERINITIYAKNDDGSINLDVGLKLEQDIRKRWVLVKLQKDKEYEIGGFNKEDIAILSLYIAVRGMFRQLEIDDNVKGKLRNVNQDLNEGQIILQSTIKEHYFSLYEKKEGRICLSKEGDKYNVYYYSFLGKEIPISMKRPISSALVVVYNHARMLEEYEYIITPWIINKSIALEKLEHLKMIYFGK